jgi:hypothetical protein
LTLASLKKGKKSWRGEKLPALIPVPDGTEFGKISLARQANSPPSANRRFDFQKRSQLFIRMHNETLSVITVRVSNEDCSTTRIHGCDAAPTPIGFAQIVLANRNAVEPRPSSSGGLCGQAGRVGIAGATIKTLWRAPTAREKRPAHADSAPGQ